MVGFMVLRAQFWTLGWEQDRNQPREEPGVPTLPAEGWGPLGDML